MGHSQADKAATHERIVRIAAKRFRERGLDGIGVADLMKEAGLTVGGFYKHFGSRDELVAEAMRVAFDNWQTQLDRRSAEGKPSGFADLVAAYLSAAHRDNPGAGCALSALAPELARSDARTRDLATEAVRHDIGILETRLELAGSEASRARAILAMSALIGAVALARAVSDEALSAEILESVRAQLTGEQSPQP